MKFSFKTFFFIINVVLCMPQWLYCCCFSKTKEHNYTHLAVHLKNLNKISSMGYAHAKPITALESATFNLFSLIGNNLELLSTTRAKDDIELLDNFWNPHQADLTQSDKAHKTMKDFLSKYKKEIQEKIPATTRYYLEIQNFSKYANEQKLNG